ncbi:triphosphoribosyl-dephospho-CoA synthase MdcB [Rhizobium paknamense]|uniref:Probable 2-(5''-triphosphoribosyl)-3'-dephosphocoenzyme-A synthase n=1 Tax=Rhizobium paknamense TaxID=1206817 RepID=A0ABU0IBQ0_9HYPH|nr:triphosphoribosyl-dephospho-CoA synthase MdcB [Rhizobium paknamense]MDQ0455657.1 triphosphoribosyl-dephospho-CoA synthase [Rhizobium paknamense]
MTVLASNDPAGFDAAPAEKLASNAGHAAFCSFLGRLAIRALYHEVALYPKPGLVSPVDNGSHRDMTMETFMRSLFALRGYFPAVAAAGAQFRPLQDMQRLGIEAEARMMAATGGINTHRGAIFNLGLIAAAAAHRQARGKTLEADAVCHEIAALWGAEILASRPPLNQSNGLKAVANHGGTGAREQAATAYPVLRQAALPAYRQALSEGRTATEASLQALFAIMAVLNDTNILHRAGAEGLAVVQQESRAFLACGGIMARNGRERAIALHRQFCERRISPGGAADLLSCTLFLHGLECFKGKWEPVFRPGTRKNPLETS